MVSSEMVQDTRKSYAWTRHVACEVAHIWKVARVFSDNSTERRADEARMPAASAGHRLRARLQNARPTSIADRRARSSLGLQDMSSPQSRFFVSQGLRLHYADWGNEGAPPRLLGHGGGVHCRSGVGIPRPWRPLFQWLRPAFRGPGDSIGQKGAAICRPEM